MSGATIVVPCYNEGSRLDEAAFARLVESGDLLEVLFVDDGSRDNTGECLSRLRTRAPGRIRVLVLDDNQGKAEAVRRGLRAALQDRAEIVGYYDADLATPPEELIRMVMAMQEIDADVLLASRVLLLGRAIERSAVRHYLGRVFATFASMTLRVPVYDTQCGAKLFRATPQLMGALDEPFLSRWAFDVELLGRLLAGTPDLPGMPVWRIVEEPLRVWRDIPGSKLKAHHMIGAAFDMARIALDLRRRRATTDRSSRVRARARASIGKVP